MLPNYIYNSTKIFLLSPSYKKYTSSINYIMWITISIVRSLTPSNSLYSFRFFRQTHRWINPIRGIQPVLFLFWEIKFANHAVPGNTTDKWCFFHTLRRSKNKKKNKSCMRKQRTKMRTIFSIWHFLAFWSFGGKIKRGFAFGFLLKEFNSA